MTADADIDTAPDWTAPTFWSELAACQRARIPGVWRRPFGDAPITPERAFAWAVSGAERSRAGDRRARYRVYDPTGRERPPDPSLLPCAADGAMATYVGRLDADTPESGLVINNVQSLSGDAWRTCRGFLGELHRHLGQTVGGASCELFAGAYRRGAFGVHKDEQDVFTLVVEGRKRFVLWPYARFADRPEVPLASELKPVALSRFDHRAQMEGAVVLEGEPGDVLFWPAEWWHVAESDGALCTTLGVGIIHGISLARIAEDVAAEVALEGSPSPIPTRMPRPGSATATLLAALSSPDLAARIEDKVMAMASVVGCRATPDPHDAPAPSDPETLVRGAPGAIHLRVAGGTLTWALLGAVLHYPAAPALVTLVERLASGEPQRVGDLYTLADAGVTPSAIAHVLDLVHQSWALEVVPPRQGA